MADETTTADANGNTGAAATSESTNTGAETQGSLLGGEDNKPEGGSLLGSEGEGDKPKEGEGDKPKEGGDDKPKEGEGAPEAYEDFTLPDGMELDEGMQTQFTEVAKELNLNQEGAQKLVSLYADKVKESVTAQQAALAQQREEWRAEITKDPNHKETVGMAKRAVEKFATGKAEGAKELFTGASWLGDNPAVVNFLANVGRVISEDTFIEGGSSGDGGNKSPASILYPNQK